VKHLEKLPARPLVEMGLLTSSACLRRLHVKGFIKFDIGLSENRVYSQL